MTCVNQPPRELSPDLLWQHVEDTWKTADEAFTNRFSSGGKWLLTCYDTGMVDFYKKHCLALMAYAKFENRNPLSSPHYLAVRQLLITGRQTDVFCQDIRGFPKLPLREDIYGPSLQTQ